jgi:predicted transposase/invertase (TIGR01784 family)
LLEVEDTSFIDSNLAESRADLLVRTSFAGTPALIYILVEHKSYPDRWAVFQLLKYMVRIWERERRASRGANTLPVIIPVLFYHGRLRWRPPPDFSSYFISEIELDQYIPAFRPVMVDLQQREDSSLQGSIMVQVALKVLKHALGNLHPYLGEILQNVAKLPVDKKYRVFIERLLEYIIKGCRDIAEQDVEQAILSLDSPQAREAYMTVADQLIARGKAEGELHGKQESLLKLLVQKFGTVSKADEKKVVDAKDPNRLDQALGLILTADSIEEVLRPLD